MHLTTATQSHYFARQISPCTMQSNHITVIGFTGQQILEEFSGKSIARMYIGNWSNYEEMMMEKFGKDLQPHRVKYRQLKR